MYSKNMTKRNIIYLTISVFIFLPLLSYAINPLHKSSDKIKNKLLKKTKIGFTKEKVKEIGKAQLSLILREDEYGPPDREMVIPFKDIVHTYLEAELGSHFSHDYFVFSTYVYAYWVFDRNDKLLDILVYKETDAL